MKPHKKKSYPKVVEEGAATSELCGPDTAGCEVWAWLRMDWIICMTSIAEAVDEDKVVGWEEVVVMAGVVVSPLTPLALDIDCK